MSDVERRFTEKNAQIAELQAVVKELVTLDDKNAPAVMDYDEFKRRWKAMMTAANNLIAKELV